MSVRQYIGARYVPRFSDVNGGVWSNVYSYEPLTIVKNGNDYYTSKKSVPVGIQITNTEYWVKTGDYNGAIAALDTKVNTLQSTMHNRKFILIGDSFGYGISPGYSSSTGIGWIKNFVNSAGSYYDTYYSTLQVIAGNPGFAATLPFLTMLQDVETNLTIDPREITDIVVLGGSNDFNYVSNVEAAIQTFCQYADTHFVNAKVKIGVIGSGIARLKAEIVPYYSRCTKYGAEYIGDLLHLYSIPNYVSSDGTHLTQEGYAYYTRWVNDAILTGKCDYVHTFTVQADLVTANFAARDASEEVMNTVWTVDKNGFKLSIVNSNSNPTTFVKPTDRTYQFGDKRVLDLRQKVQTDAIVNICTTQSIIRKVSDGTTAPVQSARLYMFDQEHISIGLGFIIGNPHQGDSAYELYIPYNCINAVLN